jgi:hypothetical protein
MFFVRSAALLTAASVFSTALAACEVNGQTSQVNCSQTTVLPQTEFTQNLVVAERTDAYGIFDMITVEPGAELILHGTARWTVTVLPGARLTVRGMAQIVDNQGGDVVVRGMVDQINATDGSTVIAGTVGAVDGMGDVQITHGAVLGGRVESRGQPGSQFTVER